MKVRFIALAAAAVLALAGCSISATDTGEPYPAAEAGMAGPAVAADEMAVAAPQKATVDQQVIRTAYVTMRVDDVMRAAMDLRSLVSGRSGQVTSEDDRTDGDSQYSTITAQVPAADLDAFLADVARLGTVDSLSVTAQDVTQQVVDLDARIAALRTSIDRMNELLAQAERIEDLLAIETQLSARQAELDSLVAQREWLSTQVAMSSVTVSLSPSTELANVDAPGFWSGLASGWAAFVAFLGILVTAAGFLLPFALVVAIIVIPIVIVTVRRSRRRRAARSAPAGQPGPSGQSGQDVLAVESQDGS